MIGVEDIKYGDIVVVGDARGKNSIGIINEIDVDKETFSCVDIEKSVSGNNLNSMSNRKISTIIAVNPDGFTSCDRGKARIIVSMFGCSKKIYDKAKDRLVSLADDIKDQL
jgi:hypothetical protein